MLQPQLPQGWKEVGAAQQARHTCAKISQPTIGQGSQLGKGNIITQSCLQLGNVIQQLCSAEPRPMATGSSSTPAKVSTG